MNIFILHRDASIAASMLCDKHVVKMVLETAQMLSTVMERYGMKAPYKPTHQHHRCTVWAGQTKSNYIWLYDHGIALCREYTNRYGKIHKCEEYFNTFFTNIPDAIPAGPLTDFAMAMPDQYKEKDVVAAYRNYYINEKLGFAKWKNGNVPMWVTEKRKD